MTTYIRNTGSRTRQGERTQGEDDLLKFLAHYRM